MFVDVEIQCSRAFVPIVYVVVTVLGAATFAYVPIDVTLPENATIPAACGCTFRSC
jgi:hypothetical protein